MTTATHYVGKPIDRVDGRAKVTGQARYAAEYPVPDLAYGYVVSSDIARGTISKIDASEALRLPGVIEVVTHENAPRLTSLSRKWRDEVAPPGKPFRPLYDNKVKFSAQPIALVVAETFELARYAASLVQVSYRRQKHATDLEAQRPNAYQPKERDGMAPPPPRGDADRALERAAVQLDLEYRCPVEHHNPMEMFTTTAVREADGTLTVYDKTQGVQNVRNYLCNVFGVAEDELRVVSPYVGGAFGSGLRPQYQVFLAVMAARELQRSVRVTLTRQQMFSFGHRPATMQRVALGASSTGKLEAIVHEAIAETSRFEDYSETVTTWSGLAYQCDNVRLDHKVVPLDVYTPSDMRAPGAVWGLFALESAMDELAVKVGMDPVALRLKNYADKDQIEDKPFSSKELRACYKQAAERFGWERRNPEPRSMRDGNILIGWGMAGGVWEAMQQEAAAKAVLTADGKLTVSSATADIGTGTYTIMTQLAAEMLGLPLQSVTFKLGDSLLPQAPVEGGSFTAATIGSAVKAVCERVRHRLFELAKILDNSPLANLELADVTFADGKMFSSNDPAKAVSFSDAMRHANLKAIEEEASAEPSSQREKYSCYTHSAIFAEVRVDEDHHMVHVTRVVSAVAGGRILNLKTARSQLMGGIVWGIGMALHEETVMDHTFGRFMTHNLADYHVPVNADIGNIDVIFVEEHDEVVNPLGAKGLGEIGVVGVAAAIANAVYHATGKRVRDLPITLDKLL